MAQTEATTDTPTPEARRGSRSSRVRLQRFALRRGARRPLRAAPEYDNVVAPEAAGRARALRGRRARRPRHPRRALAEDRRDLPAREPKRVYYLSIEFLIGRSLANNVMNLMLDPVVPKTFDEHGRVWMELLDQEPDAGLGNGGLGRLAACFLDSMATMALPAMGYGLRYEHGISSRASRNGWQVEKPGQLAACTRTPGRSCARSSGSRSSSAARSSCATARSGSSRTSPRR